MAKVVTPVRNVQIETVVKRASSPIQAATAQTQTPFILGDATCEKLLPIIRKCLREGEAVACRCMQ